MNAVRGLYIVTAICGLFSVWFLHRALTLSGNFRSDNAHRRGFGIVGCYGWLAF